MKILTMRRTALLCAGLGAVGAISAVAFTGTSAQFTSTDNTGQTNSFAAGTVNLTGTATNTINFDDLQPGDQAGILGKTRSNYQLDYTGSLPAFVAVDLTVNSAAKYGPGSACSPTPGTYNNSGTGLDANNNPIAGSMNTLAAECGGGTGTLPLFNGAWNTGSANQPNLGALTIDYGQNNGSIVVYSSLASVATCTVVDQSTPITCTSEIDNVELKSDENNTSDASAYEQWNDGDSVKLRLDVWMLASAGNAFQGSSADIEIHGHAVQWDNNNTSGTVPSPGVTSGPGAAANAAAIAGLCSTATTTSETFQRSVVADSSGAFYCPVSWS